MLEPTQAFDSIIKTFFQAKDSRAGMYGYPKTRQV